MTLQKESPGVAGRGFRDYRGVIQQPQAKLEANCQNCQENSEPVDLLKEHYFRHAETMSHKWREIVQIEFLLSHHVAQIEQLEAQLEDARSEYEEEQAEMVRLQRLARGGA
jgi:hypothetical protein